MVEFHVHADSITRQSSISKDTYSSSDVLQAMEVSVPPVGFLPPAVRYVSADHRIAIWERPPTIINSEFTYHLDDDSKHSQVFEIPYPWTVAAYCFGPNLAKLDCIYLFGRNSSLFSEEDKLFHLPYPNIYDNGKVCLGEALTINYRNWAKAQTNLTLAQAITYASGLLWSMSMNNEVSTWLMPWRLPNCLPPNCQVGLQELSYQNDSTARHILSVYSKYSLLQVCQQFEMAALVNEFTETNQPETISDFIAYLNQTRPSKPVYDPISLPTLNSAFMIVRRKEYEKKREEQKAAKKVKQVDDELSNLYAVLTESLVYPTTLSSPQASSVHTMLIQHDAVDEDDYEDSYEEEEDADEIF